MFDAQYRFNKYVSDVNHAQSKAEVEKLIKGFKCWLFNHRHIESVQSIKSNAELQIRMDKSKWKIK